MSHHGAVQTVLSHDARLAPSLLGLAPLGSSVLEPNLYSISTRPHTLATLCAYRGRATDNATGLEMWYQVAVMEKRQHVRKSVEARSLFSVKTPKKDFVLRRISDVLFCDFLALVFGP